MINQSRVKSEQRHPLKTIQVLCKCSGGRLRPSKSILNASSNAIDTETLVELQVPCILVTTSEVANQDEVSKLKHFQFHKRIFGNV